MDDDAYGTTAYHADSVDYDHNANVAAITDAATGRNQRGNRTMTYDGLDRLKTVASPMFGTTGATYTHDVLDNLTRVTLGGAAARDHHYCYDVDHVFVPKPQLEALVTRFGSQEVAMLRIHEAAQSFSGAANGTIMPGAIIQVGQANVWVQGRVLDGVFRVASASMRGVP